MFCTVGGSAEEESKGEGAAAEVCVSPAGEERDESYRCNCEYVVEDGLRELGWVNISGQR